MLCALTMFLGSALTFCARVVIYKNVLCVQRGVLDGNPEIKSSGLSKKQKKKKKDFWLGCVFAMQIQTHTQTYFF